MSTTITGNSLPSFAQSDGKITGTVLLDNPTGNEAALTLNYTTNKATSGNDTGLLINMTDTVSPGTSLLQDWQVGGTSKVSIDNTGLFLGQRIRSQDYFMTSGQGIRTNSNETLILQNSITISATDNGVETQGTYSGAGVTQVAVAILPTINQSTTSSMTDLLINRTETAVGSGEQLLLAMGTTALGVLTKFRNDGVWFPRQAVTASAPTYTEGGIYYDTTLHKLRIGGAAGWETITSV